MKSFLVFLLLILAFVGGVAGAVYFLPDDMVIVQRQEIAAPPEKVFEYVNSFKKKTEWSPWFDIDPSTGKEYSDSDSGVGAWFKWKSENKKVGEGKEEIIEIVPNQLVRTKLTFAKPNEGTATADMVLRPVGKDKTEVTWMVQMKPSYVDKGFFLVFKVPQELKKTFGNGLDKLNKVVSEKK